VLLRVLRTPLLLAALVATAGTAAANPASVVPGGGSGSDGNADLYGEIDYSYQLSSSTLVRERVGSGADPRGAIPLRTDLEFKQFRHVITPRLQLGVFHDTFVYVAMPIVVNQVRELRLAGGVTRDSSSTVRDGLVTADGFDARDPGTATTGDMLFRGPSRHGLEQIHVGAGVAPMNQASDPTKPTWKIGAEVRLAIGQIMAFDRMRPDDNHGVSEGVQELKLWTSFARKLGWAEPWVEVWWLVPLTSRGGALFDDPGYGSSNADKSQQGGVGFGLEILALNRPADQTRISVDLGTRVNAHFEGREYTEMWEAFAYAGDSRAGGPLVLDRDPTNDGVQALSHPGISNIENYLETSGRFGVRAQIGPHVQFAVLADLIWKTDHAISFADAGVDHPTCTGSNTPCETDDNDLVNPGTDEVNPLHSQTIDLAGHRYISVDNFDFVLGVEGQVLF